MEEKKHLRSILRKINESSDSGALWSKLETISAFSDADVVLLFWSIEGEPDTHDFIGKLSRSKTVVLPVVKGDALELRKYDPQKMAPGYRGILEPGPDAECVDPSEVQFAVIPGMAFDRSGNRLGRGKGYYDRIIPLLNCPLAGICLDTHLVDEVPVEKHDMPVDIVITPNNLYICKLLNDNGK